jgi:hypothetical protein
MVGARAKQLNPFETGRAPQQVVWHAKTEHHVGSASNQCQDVIVGSAGAVGDFHSWGRLLNDFSQFRRERDGGDDFHSGYTGNLARWWRWLQAAIAAIEHERPQAYDRGRSGSGKGAEMNRLTIFAAIAFSAALLTAFSSGAQDINSNSQFQSEGQGPGLNQPAPQGEENDSTLELAPQPGAQKPRVEEIPASRSFHPDSDTTSLDRNFNPDTENGDSSRFSRHGRPYLGVEVQWASECFKGAEEYGLKVTKVDPQSPASVAGLQAGHEITPAGAAAITLTGLIPLATPLLGHFLNQPGAPGNDGDLIIAVDDQRIRNQQDLDDKMAQLKPGDTLYLTVVRPSGDGSHKTLKIAVRVGEWGQPVAKADSASNGTAPQ